MPSWIGKLALGVGTMLIGAALVSGVSAFGDVKTQGVRLTHVEHDMAASKQQQEKVFKLVSETREDAAEFRGTAKAISKQLDSIEARIVAQEAR